MTDLYTIVTPKSEIEHQSRVRPIPKYEKRFQARSGDLLPVISKTRNTVTGVKAVWGIEDGRRTYYTIPMEKILVRKPFNIWFHKHRCAIPANCFFAHKDEKAFLVRVLKQRLFMLGGICLPAGEHRKKPQFAILTTDAADILTTITDTMPVNFSPHKTIEWIQQETILKVMQLADSSGDRWFDYFKVHPRIIEPKWNEKDLLRPIGISFREWQEREEKLNAIEVSEDRFNRRNSKGR